MGNADTKSVALIALGVALALALQVHFLNVTFDDAYISFRYARNWGRGLGLVFNPGERLEGYSNFLWTLLLGAAFRLGIDRWEYGPLVLAKVLGSALSFVTLGVQLRASRARLGDRSLTAGSALAVLYIAANSCFALWAVGALETALVTFFTVLFLYWYLQDELADAPTTGKVSRASCALLLAALTRPEPASLFAAVMLFRVLDGLRSGTLSARYRDHIRFAATFALPFAAYLAFRFAYYGDLLPNTYYAKIYLDPRVWPRGLTYLADAADEQSWTLLGAILLPILVAAGLTRRSLFLIWVVAAQLLAGAWEGGDWMPAYRLYVPALPAIGLLLQACFEAALRLIEHGPAVASLPRWLLREERVLRIWDRLTWPVVRLRDFLRKKWPITRAAVTVAFAAALISVSVGSFRSVRLWNLVSGYTRIQLDCFGHFEIARWMKASIRDDGLLAIGEAGVIPYYTDLPVLDLFGLLDRHIARRPGIRHHKFDEDYVLSRRPKYVLLMVQQSSDGQLVSDFPHGQILLADSRFLSRYEPWRDFPEARLYREKAPARADLP